MTTAQGFYEIITAKGGSFYMSNSRVLVRGIAPTIEDVGTLEKHNIELMSMLRTVERIVPTIPIAPTSTELETLCKDWKQFYTEEKGYDWQRSSWLIEVRADILADTKARYEAGTATLGDVHNAFVALTEAHKPRHYVKQDGRLVQVIAEQLQPSQEDHRRMLNLLGVDNKTYMREVGIL